MDSKKEIEIKLKKQTDFIENKITEQERGALRDYIGYNYQEINNLLRSGSGEISDTIALIDNVFNRVPPIEDPILVYRGIKQGLFVDDKMTDKAIVSTSLDKNVAFSFSSGECCILNITLPKGSKVLPLFDKKTGSAENEILLKRDSKFITLRNYKLPFSNAPYNKIHYDVVYVSPLDGKIEDIRDMSLDRATELLMKDVLMRLANSIPEDEKEFLDTRDDYYKILSIAFDHFKFPIDIKEISINATIDEYFPQLK
jgi:hypothetical protein